MESPHRIKSSPGRYGRRDVEREVSRQDDLPTSIEWGLNCGNVDCGIAGSGDQDRLRPGQRSPGRSRNHNREKETCGVSNHVSELLLFFEHQTLLRSAAGVPGGNLHN
jgi:hypothetical protein